MLGSNSRSFFQYQSVADLVVKLLAQPLLMRPHLIILRTRVRVLVKSRRIRNE